MNSEKTDDSLKSFIFTFKINLDRFNEIIRDLYQQITDGSKGIEQLFIETNRTHDDIRQQQKQLFEQITSNQNQTNEHSLEKIYELLNLSNE